MSTRRTEGFWRERARGVGLVIALGLSVLAVAAAIATGVLWVVSW